MSEFACIGKAITIDCLKPSSAFRCFLQQWSMEERLRCGNSSYVERTSKLVWSSVDSRQTKLLLTLSKRELNVPKHVLTGHLPLSYRIYKLGISWVYGLHRRWHTLQHYLCEWPAFCWMIRCHDAYNSAIAEMCALVWYKLKLFTKSRELFAMFG